MQDEANVYDEEEEKEYRALELKYDQLYREIFEQRARVLAGPSAHQQR